MLELSQQAGDSLARPSARAAAVPGFQTAPKPGRTGRDPSVSARHGLGGDQLHSGALSRASPAWLTPNHRPRFIPRAVVWVLGAEGGRAVFPVPGGIFRGDGTQQKCGTGGAGSGAKRCRWRGAGLFVPRVTRFAECLLLVVLLFSV